MQERNGYSYMGGDAAGCVRVPDQIRQDRTGDTAQYGGVQASRRATPHGVQALRWHKENNSDNNGTQRVTNGPVRPGSLGRTVQALFSWSVADLITSYFRFGRHVPNRFMHLLQLRQGLSDISG